MCLQLWQKGAADMRGQSLPCGYLIADEDPAGLLAAISSACPRFASQEKAMSFAKFRSRERFGHG
jgi:hypothetical protein